MTEDGAQDSRKRVTLADVAQAAGVSSAAVSLAIRGEPGVSRETRARVVDAARRLGYRGVSRSSGRRGRQVTVGLIIKAPHGDAPEVNRFYAPVMTGIEEICRIREVDLLFAAMPVDDEYYPLDVPRLVTERSTDGLIVVGAHLSHGTTALLEDGPPAILVDAYAEDVAFDSVVSDNVGGARAAMEHLSAAAIARSPSSAAGRTRFPASCSDAAGTSRRSPRPSSRHGSSMCPTCHRKRQRQRRSSTSRRIPR